MLGKKKPAQQVPAEVSLAVPFQLSKLASVEGFDHGAIHHRGNSAALVAHMSFPRKTLSFEFL